MFEAVNAGWMELEIEGTEHVAGTTSARDVFEAAQNLTKPKSPLRVAMEARDIHAVAACIRGRRRLPLATYRAVCLPWTGPDRAAAASDLRRLRGFPLHRRTIRRAGWLPRRPRADRRAGHRNSRSHAVRAGRSGSSTSPSSFDRSRRRRAALRVIGAALGRLKSPALAATISALSYPLATMARLGDSVGVSLLRPTS